MMTAFRKNKDIYILCGILFLGFLLRGAYLLEMAENPDFANPILDANFHDYWARGIATETWSLPEGHPDPLIESTPYQKSPGYPWFLAFVYSIFGPGYFSPRIVQMVLGLANGILAFRLGKKWFGRETGLIFSAFLSFYWIFIYFEGELYQSALLVFLVLTLISAISGWTEKISFFSCAATGFLCGLTALVRSNILLFVPVVLLWLAWVLFRRKNLRLFFVPAVGFLTGILLAIIPVTIRNYVVAQDFVLISSNGGLNLFIGNNEISDGVNPFIPRLKELTGLESWTPYEYPLIINAVGRKLEQPLKHSEVSSYWTKEALRYIKEKPWEWLSLTVKKSLLFWGPREIANPIEVRYARRDSRILKYLPGNFPFLLSLSLLGAAFWFMDIRTPCGRDGPLLETGKKRYEVGVLIFLFISVYFVSFLPFLVSARFRVPVIPFLLLFGSYGIHSIGAFFKGRNLRKIVYSVLAYSIIYVPASINWTGYETDAARYHYLRGTAYDQNGQENKAVEEFLKALQIKPDYDMAHDYMGIIMKNQGKLDEALTHFTKALRSNPHYAEAHYHLGDTFAKLKKPDEAIRHFSRAVRIKPDYAKAHFALGSLFAEQGRFHEAIAHYSNAWKIQPDNADVHYGLGFALAGSGKVDEAMIHYDEALRIKPDFIEVHNNLGNTLAGMGNLVEAVKHYSRALAINPELAETHFNLGVVLAKLGNGKEAMAYFSEALRIKPDFQDAKRQLELASGAMQKYN